jgi:hypothetical protein
MENQQLIKKDRSANSYSKIFPWTFTDLVLDRVTKESLDNILVRNNFIALPYVGSKAATRLQVPMKNRRRGIWLSYIDYAGTLTVEYYNDNNLDNNHWQDSSYWLPYNTAEFQPASVGLSALAQEVFDWINSQITTAVKLNPEDLQKNSSGQIEEANRAYDTSTFSGLGYRILRKNIQSNKNILTQSMINMPNNVYKIRYDFDLNGATINLPANSVLQFVGGSIKNGTINFSNTLLSGDVKIKTNISGNIRNGDIYPEWFGAVGDGIIDDSNAFLTAFELISNSFISIDKFRRVGYTNTLVLDTNKKYYITSSLELNFASINIKGAGTLIYGGKNHCMKFTKCTGVNIDISFIAKSDFIDTYKVDWNDNPNRTAIILDGVRESNFKFDKIVGFTKGIVVTGDGNYGCCNNYFKLASMYNLYKSIVIESFNQYWPNDNVVEGGYFIGNIGEVANTIIKSPTAIRSFIEINGDSIYPITSWKFKDCYFQGQLAVLTNGDNIVTKVFYANQYCKNFKFENIAIEDTTSSTGSVFHFNNDQCKDIEIDTIDYVDNYNFNYLGFISNDWNYLKRLHNITFKQREGLQEIYRINVSKYYEVPFRVERSTSDDGGILLSNDLNPIFDLKNSKFVNRYNPNKSFPIPGNLLSVTKGQIYYYDLKPAGNIRIIFMKSDYSVLTSNEYNSQTDIDIFSNIGITLRTYQDKSYYITGSTNGTNLTINMLNNTLIKYIYVCSSNSTELIISQNKYSTAVKKFIFENNQYRNGGFIINQNINSAMLTALTGDRIYNLYDNKEYRIINSGTKGLDLSDITVTAIKGNSYITVTGNISKFKIGNIVIIDNYQYTIRSISGQSLYVTPSIQSSVTNTTVSFKKLIFEDSDKNVDGTLLSKEVIVRSIDEITLPNIIYKIVSDIDLNNTTLTLPANCTLDFQGGSFSNGTIIGSNTRFSGNIKLDTTLTFSGTYLLDTVNVDWFYTTRGSDASPYIQAALDFAKLIKASVTFGNKLTSGYVIGTTLNCEVPIIGNNARLSSTTVGVLNCKDECSLDNLYIDFYPYQGVSGVTDNKVVAVNIGGDTTTYNHYINNVTIDGFYYGIVMTNAWNLRCSNLRIIRTRVGIQAYGKCVNNSIVNANIDCKGTNSICIAFNDEVDHAASTYLSEGWTISNSILTSAQYGIFGVNMSNSFISNCIIDLCSKNAIKFSLNSLNIRIVDNYLACLANGIDVINFSGQNVLNNEDAGIIISNNTIKSYYSDSGACNGINIGEGTYESIYILGNTISNLGGIGIVSLKGEITHINVSDNRFKINVGGYFYVLKATNKYIANNNAIDNYNNSGIKVANKMIIVADRAPTSNTKTWNAGDICLNSKASVGSIIGWFCATSGSPGTWFPIGTIEQYAGLKKQGTTAERPAMNQNYIGATYYDTTLKKMILWNGTAWTNLDGSALA